MLAPAGRRGEKRPAFSAYNDGYMPYSRSLHLFRAFGIDVYLHWSWFVIALFEIQARSHAYTSIGWNVLEYLALFAIVTMHEFGHALACRSVGGAADRIVLWPLGGVAYVDPPPTPAATLWSIAAGPLVNVALVPLLALLAFLAASLGISNPNLLAFLHAIFDINLVLLIFNILPIYPLDGGQILQSLLWFPLGRARSLMISTGLGFVGVALFLVLALWSQDLWLGAIAIFILLNCWSGLKHARLLWRRSKLPRHAAYVCPWCKSSPPVGDYWKCNLCGQNFDGFLTRAACPHCAARFDNVEIRCMDCGRNHPLAAWTPSVDISPAALVKNFNL